MAMAGIGVVLVVYAAAIAGLLLAGRRADARELATFIPDCSMLRSAGPVLLR